MTASRRFLFTEKETNVNSQERTEQTRIWYNFETDEYEECGPPETDGDALRFLPRDQSARNMYAIYREQGGLSILESMVNVLSACVKEKQPYEPSFGQ